MHVAAAIARHPVFTYVALAFAISWGGVALAVGPGGFPGTVEEFEARLLAVVLAMLAGPSVAGVTAIALADRRSGLRDLWARVLTVRVGLRWYLAAILIAPLSVSATLFALSVASPEFRPGILSAAAVASHVAIGLVTGLAAGLFEELCWTGIAVPKVRRRHGILATGCLVGLVWGAWHLLVTWWGSTSSAGGVSMAIYLPVMTLSFLPPYRVLMVWVYDRTRSVGVAMLMHASLTASVRVFDPIEISGVPILIYNLALAAVLWLVVTATVGRSGSAGGPHAP
jgi:membrane protease YdiL (CAAX protease family)